VSTAVGSLTIPRPHAERTGLLVWVASVDHKQIGIMYMLAALVFFSLGGIEALLMRIQLAVPNNHFLNPDTFNQLFTVHGTTMIFFVAMPMLAGMTAYMVPLMIGAKDVAFPRLNALSFWVMLFGGILFYLSFFTGGASNAGWFAYTPLSEPGFSSTNGVTYWICGLLAAGVGTVTGAINMIVTIIKLRAPGMTIRRVPLFIWMTLVNSFLMLAALSVLNAALVMLLIDRQFNAQVFAPAFGGSAMLWQHYFWGFGHPEVYIVILPSFGMISEVIPVFARKPIYGYEFVAGSTVAIAFLSFGVWAHHMFTVGMGTVLDLFFGAMSMTIAVPTGVKIFNWTATLFHARIRFTTAMLFAIGFILTFTMGGLTGITFAVVPIDYQLTDTYYLVAHFHYTLFGGTVLAIFAGFYYWFPKISGRMLSERIGRWHFWLTLIGFHTTFLVQHFLGLMGMPRRVFTYPDLPGWGLLNMISTIGAFILLASVVALVLNLYVSLTAGEAAGDNPWDAWTLEWATTSPPPPENFTRVPPVHGRRPLWDLAHPELNDERVAAAAEA